MNVLGNILWIVFGGLVITLGYFVAGILLCFTIIWIPFGYQAIKIGIFAFTPFGKTTVVTARGSGCLSAVLNIIWIIYAGVWLALLHFVLGLLFCITIVGIPFGLQHFKLVPVAFTPFGREIVPC